jgi:putative acetyltransferase
MHIRAATSHDLNNIQSIYRSAFDACEMDLVSELAVNLFTDEAAPPIISLVAETAGIVVGHVSFSPVTIDDRDNFNGYILAPLAVKPAYQKRRIGSKLIESGIQQLSRMGVDIVFVYGEPEYYSRFGFNADDAERYNPPHKLQYPFGWQGIALKKSSIGKSSVKIACVDSLDDPALW